MDKYTICMISHERVYELKKLKSRIDTILTPLVNHDYRYLMMCDHQNIGDTLIMEGEFVFLSKIRPYKCKEYTTMVSFEKRKPRIPKEDLLIMRGSGSFGDIWPTAPNFWKFIMRNYPDNPILFMPQTVHFEKNENMIEMAEMISKHGKVTMCVRDSESLSIIGQNFNCKVYLVPDMAFYINLNPINKKNKESRTLIVKRNDKEAKPSKIFDVKYKNYFVTDWPTFDHVSYIEKIRRFILSKQWYNLYDFFIQYIQRPYMLHEGCKLLSPYSIVYANRMHAGILGVLMGKEVHFVDNSYGKLGRVFNTWLTNVKGVYLEV